MAAPKGNTFGRQFTPENANEMREKALEKRREKAKTEAFFEAVEELNADLLAISPADFDERVAHPSSKAEEILLQQYSDPNTAYSTMRDFHDRARGKARQQKDINVTAPSGLSVVVADKTEAEALDNLM